MVLVNIIHDNKSKDVDRVRAFKVLNEELARQLSNAVKTPSTRVGTMNVYQQDPALAQRMLDAECKECGEVMTPGVAHECEVIEAA